MHRSLKYGLYGAVLAGLISAPVVWNQVDKHVDLIVDGHAHSVTTTASDVSQVLHSQGYRLTSHDIVAPSAGSALDDGMRVVLRRGRLLHLSIDGTRRNIWTTAPTVQQALAQLGYTTTDFVSVSRSRRLPLRPTDMTIRTPQAVTVIHDGTTQHVSSTDVTVGDLLHDLGVTLGPKDRISVPETADLQQGQVIRIQRVGEKTRVKIKKIPHGTVHHDDPTLKMGKTEVTRKGRDGEQRVVYSVVFVDGKKVARTVLSKTTVRAPRNTIVSVGTEPPAQRNNAANTDTVGPPSPGSNKAIARELLAKRGWSDQYGCLVQMWDRESGWRTDAANPSGAYGIPQALPGSKMAAAGPNWQTDATTQITWGLDYIAERYGTPCGAWSFWQAHDYY
ncbi:ubiquitin-like domain-containing protein [Jatrophihabitans endophyticus]|uniref:aggregation-promoting factor C-terminal-like domain-containing protein n=1 Tax=Jatrophihabitans endophyticus TaxID=1206085 RepID=UPI0019F90B6C|nr:ubiquitin-like domain-containing protein [Jatrophihabitans endophyticus]MBE7187482.1 DUF348 domain-containing protein [Jatrophihabitans endophyticus]